MFPFPAPALSTVYPTQSPQDSPKGFIGSLRFHETKQVTLTKRPLNQTLTCYFSSRPAHGGTRTAHAIQNQRNNMNPSIIKSLAALSALNLLTTAVGAAAPNNAVVMPVASGPPLLGLLDSTTDGVNFYLNVNSSGTGYVASVTVSGGGITPVFASWGVNGIRSPSAITAIGSNLFWVDPNSGPGTGTQILRAPKTGGSVTAIFTGSTITDGSGIATDGTNLFVADEVGGRVFRLSADGTGLTLLGPDRYPGGFANEHGNKVA